MQGARAVLLVGALACAGCREDTAPAEDRTLQKLREEQALHPAGPFSPARGHSGPPVEDPNAQLALRASSEDSAPTRVAVPAKSPTVQVGAVSFRIESLARSGTVGSGAIRLTSDQSFLTVTLALKNTAAEATGVDLGFIRVTTGADAGVFAIARDAQHVAGTRVISFRLERGAAESVALVFEVPPGGPAAGWELLLPAATTSGGSQDVKIPLQ